jgi:hypothetical protein
MADDQKTLDILIRTQAELAGAKSLEQSLEQSIGKAKALGDVDELKKLAPQLDAVRASLKGAKVETEEASSATAEHTKHLENGRMVFMELNKLIPGLGDALHAAFSGPIGPVILLGIAIAEIESKLNEYNTELDKVTEHELTTHLANIADLKKAWDDAQLSLGQYFADLATAGEEKDPIKKKLDNIKELTDAQIAASEKIIETLGKQEVAYLRANGGTPEQIAIAEERTRRQVEVLNSRKQFGDGLGGLLAEQKQRQSADAGLKDEALAAKKIADKSKNALAEKEKELKNLRGESGLGDEGPKNEVFAAEQKKLAELQKEFDARSKQYNGGDSYVAGVAKSEMDRLQAEMDEITGGQKNRQNLISQLESDLAPLSTAADTAAADYENKKNQSLTNHRRLRELPGEIEQARKVQGATDYGRQAMDVINARDQKTGETLGEMGAQLHMTTDQISIVVDRILKHQLTVQQAFAGFEARIKWLEEQQARTENNTNLH